MPLAERFAPGLSASEIAQLEAQYETSFPPELVTWWRWSNGVTVLTEQEARDYPHDYLWPGPALLSSSSSRDRAAMMRKIALEVNLPPENPLEIWAATWVPLTLNISGGLLFCDAAAGRPDGTCAVQYTSAWQENGAVEVTATIEGLLRRWLELVDQGWFYFDEDRREWVSQDAPEPTDTGYLRG